MDFLGIFQDSTQQQNQQPKKNQQNQQYQQPQNQQYQQQQNQQYQQQQNQQYGQLNQQYQQQQNQQYQQQYQQSNQEYGQFNQKNNRKNNNKKTNGFNVINIEMEQEFKNNNQKQNQQKNENQQDRGFFSTMTNTLGLTSPNNQQIQQNQQYQQNTVSENAVILSNKNMINLNKNNKTNKNNKNQQQNQQKNQEEKGFFNTITNAVGITETVQETPKNTQSIYKSINISKKHYFIGFMLNNEEQIQNLIQIQNKLITKYKMRKFYKNWDQKFVSRFVYMGYLTPDVAQKYMEKLMKDLCVQIANKFSKLVCKYKKISPKFDKSMNWVSISYNDKNDYLSKVIIPFLDKYGIKPIFPNRKTIYLPLIDIIHFKQSSLSKQDVIDIPIPSGTFTIDHLSLLSGKPTQTKIGGQSIHDRLAYEEEGKYYFPLKI